MLSIALEASLAGLATPRYNRSFSQYDGGCFVRHTSDVDDMRMSGDGTVSVDAVGWRAGYFVRIIVNNFVQHLVVCLFGRPSPTCLAVRRGARPRYRETVMARESAVKRTHLVLRDLIVRGAIAPGSPLIEQRVADSVGASRSTVRNALQQLANEGFVQTGSIGEHYSRFFVGPLTIEEMREWYFLFGAIDGIAARGAAVLPKAKRGSLAARVRELAAAHVEAGSGEDPQYDRIQRLDNELHGTYVRAGGGPRVLQEHASIRPHVDRYGTFYATALIKRLPSEIHAEHVAIADAIQAGDADAAEAAAVANWRNATDRFESVMRIWGERGNWTLGTPPDSGGLGSDT